jgi:hypothetical protein
MTAKIAVFFTIFFLFQFSEAILLLVDLLYGFRAAVIIPEKGRYSLDFEKALLDMFVTDILR